MSDKAEALENAISEYVQASYPEVNLGVTGWVLAFDAADLEADEKRTLFSHAVGPATRPPAALGLLELAGEDIKRQLLR